MGGGLNGFKFYEELGEELIAFAEQEFRGARQVGDGATEREHTDAAARIRAGLPKKQQRVEPERLRCPYFLTYLWRWFLEVLAGASGGGMGPAIISWSDLKAWTELTGETVEPWETRLLLRLSSLRAEIASEDASPREGRPNRDVGVDHGRRNHVAKGKV